MEAFFYAVFCEVIPMIKTTTVILSALLLLSGAGGLSKQTNNSDEPAHRTTVRYGSTEKSTASYRTTVSYSTRTDDVYSLAYRYPTYSYAPAANSCGAIAGANLVGFFDRYYETLIPNHTAGAPFGNSFRYAPEDAAVRETIKKLYDLMMTDSVGVTMPMFIKGFFDYVRITYRTPEFVPLKEADGSFNFEKAVAQLKQNHPLVFFLDGYNIVRFTEGANTDTIDTTVSDEKHILVAFGYRTYTYDNGKTYRFFAVATGTDDRTNALYNIDADTVINDAWSVNVV